MRVWLCSLLFVACLLPLQGAAQFDMNRVELERPPDHIRKMMRQGERALTMHDVERARALLEQAHAEWPSARTERGLGMVAMESGDYVRAWILINASLQNTKRPLTDLQRARARTYRHRLGLMVGKIRVLTSATDAEIRVNGKPAPFSADGWLWVTAGAVAVEARSPTLGHAYDNVQVDGGASLVVRLEFGGRHAPTGSPVASGVREPTTTGTEPRRVPGPGDVRDPATQPRELHASAPTEATAADAPAEEATGPGKGWRGQPRWLRITVYVGAATLVAGGALVSTALLLAPDDESGYAGSTGVTLQALTAR